MSDNRPIVIEEGILKESSTSGGSVNITSSDPAIIVSQPSTGNFVIGFDAELSKVPNMIKKFTAGETISALKIVYTQIDGRVFVADSEDTFEKALAIGVALNAAATNTETDVLIFGILKDTSWNWTANDLLFLDTNGNISSVPPVVGYQTIVAKALSNDTILVSLKDPIEL